METSSIDDFDLFKSQAYNFENSTKAGVGIDIERIEKGCARIRMQDAGTCSGNDTDRISDSEDICMTMTLSSGLVTPTSKPCKCIIMTL